MCTAINKISLNRAQLQTMLNEMERTHPIEACGLLLGKIRGDTIEVTDVLCSQNVVNSPVRFEVDPEAVYQAYVRAENEGKELIGVFHSHPAPPKPSEIDLRYMEANPSFVWLILSTLDRKLAAYHWQKGKPCKIEIQIIKEGS
ncbi:MAG: M67 family metallopeptidase [Candidatus Bathyarchaeia archaeon]